MNSQRAHRWEAPVPGELWMCVVVSPVASAVCVCPSLESSLSACSRQPGTPLTTTAALEQLIYGTHTHTHTHTHRHAQLDGSKCCLTSHDVAKRPQQQSFKNNLIRHNLSLDRVALNKNSALRRTRCEPGNTAAGARVTCQRITAQCCREERARTGYGERNSKQREKMREASVVFLLTLGY